MRSLCASWICRGSRHIANAMCKIPEQIRIEWRKNLRRKSMRAISLLAILGVVLAGINAQTVEAPSAAELAEITERGRALAEYDQAAWHATDAVQMANPKTVEGQHYIAKKENERWTVVFGAL